MDLLRPFVDIRRTEAAALSFSAQVSESAKVFPYVWEQLEAPNTTPHLVIFPEAIAAPVALNLAANA